jgi:hypothetical protein
MLNRAAAMGIGVLSLMLLAAPAASAQTASPPADEAAPPQAVTPPAPPTSPPSSPSANGDDTRYSFSRVPDGYLRLDARTGQVALCSRRQVGWACQLVPDDRLVLDSEIARLQGENGKLKRELLSRGIALPSGVSAPPRTARPNEESRAPERDDLDRSLNALRTLWHRLVEMIGNMTRDVMKKS